MIRKTALIALLLALLSVEVFASGPYTTSIKKLQATDITSPYNTVFLNIDITESPCSSTNVHNRFAIVSNAQQSVILAAVLANKEITVTGLGTCNAADVEILNTVSISP